MPVSKLEVPRGSGGRPLRVLHLGNIANNAYYNAKFLRRIGVEADVLCDDNYWVMSSPEWEEAAFEGVPPDQILPDWWSLDLKGYTRPRWFAQGPFEMCVAYLLAKQQGRTHDANLLWDRMTHARRLICSPSFQRSTSAARALRRFMPSWCAARLKGIALRLRGRLVRMDPNLDGTPRRDDPSPLQPDLHRKYLERCQELIEEFARRFPERPDRLTMDDLLPHEQKAAMLGKLFINYDLVQGYATDPLFPMLAGFKPYVAFEHGTLRDAPEANWAYKGPFHDSPLGRLTALSYALADHVFVTNADCLSSAQRLGLASFEPMPHPLDEESFSMTDEHREDIRRRLGVDLVFFCPIRHDWVDKGTDKYIEALPELRRALDRPFKVCFTPWGREVHRSRALIAELGCDDLVEWVGPFGRVQLVKWLSSADVVFDQVVYPSFSGVTPRTLSCGVPVIASHDPKVMEWMFPEPAPVLSARTTAEIVQQTLTALAPGFRSRHRVEARRWIEEHHSSARVTRQMLEVYGPLLARATGPRRNGTMHQ